MDISTNAEKNSIPTNAGENGNNQQTESILMDVHETAQLFGCADSWVYRHPQLLPGMVRIGNMIRYRRSELLNFISSGGAI